MATYHHLIFTPFMFVLCAILLFWEFALNDWAAEPIAENPSYGPSVETLIEAGAKRTDLILDEGDWWRMISRKMLFMMMMMMMMEHNKKNNMWWGPPFLIYFSSIFVTIKPPRCFLKLKVPASGYCL